MKTSKLLVIALALLAALAMAAYIGGCSTEKPVQPAISTSQEPSVSTDATTTTKGEQESTALASWSEINMRIWSSALYYVGRYYGQQCKQFASDRVRDVTGYALPSTQSNWIYFNSGHVVRIIDGNTPGGGSLRSGVSAGNIIQMHIYYRNPSTGAVTDLPHTAIFSNYAPGGMNWVDCNFVPPNGLSVAIHFVSWDWFSSRVGTKYSVYQATS
jgi:hypothetical protein